MDDRISLDELVFKSPKELGQLLYSECNVVLGSDIEYIKDILIAGADVNVTVKEGYYPLGFTPLYRALSLNNANIVKVLLEAGANPNIECGGSEMAIHIATVLSGTNAIKMLVESGALIDAQDRDGWTPLHYAVANDKMNVVKLLLKFGANKYLKNDAGDTPGI